MNFHNALRALAAGKKIRRKGCAPIGLQVETVPIFTYALVTSSGVSQINDNWIMCRLPMMHDSIPRSFSDDDVSATDWMIVRDRKRRTRKRKSAELRTGVDGRKYGGSK